MQAKLIQFIDGELIISMFEVENLVPAMEGRGFAQRGINHNRHQRAELQGQPHFAGAVGPTWDEGCLRYECLAAYDRLSA